MPTGLVFDGDENPRDALNQAGGAVATPADDRAKAVVTSRGLMPLAFPGMAPLLGNSLGISISFHEPVVLAISGWMYGLSEG